MVERVKATPEALDVIERLRAQYGALEFHQTGGCCDGSAPMCLAKGELQVGATDVWLGEVGGAPFYMSQSQFVYMEHTQLTLDVAPGQGGMFSLEGPLGYRFITRSRLYSDDEFESLPPVVIGSPA
jgi:uncharacterized protein (DUF779 family)